MSGPVRIGVAVVQHAGCYLAGPRPEGVALAGYWEFPGGKAKEGETALDAAVRECLEETGLAVTAIRPLGNKAQAYDFGSVDLSFFECMPIDPRHLPLYPFRWISRSNLATLRFPDGNSDVLRLIAQGR